MLAWTGIGAAVAYVKKPSLFTNPSAHLHWLLGIEQGTLLNRLKNPAAYLTVSSIAWFYLAVFAGFILYRTYTLFLKPLDWVGNYWDPIMGTDSRKPRNKNPGDMPPAFPNGWFRACDTMDVSNGQVRFEILFNQELVVFRGRSGRPAILAAHCASCKTDLSTGRVKGDDIKCPNSACGRSYNQDGVCTSVPDGSESPSSAHALRSWPVEEGNNHIYIYHHAEGKEPTFLPTYPEEIANGYCVYHGRTEHVISAHVAEMPENGPDVAHLNFLHTDFIIKSLSPLITHWWDATWHPGKTDEDKHCAYVILDQYIRFGKSIVPGTKIHVTVTQNGLGLVCLKFETPFGYIYAFESVTPVRPLMQKFHHLVWAEWRVPRIIAKGVLKALITQAERDIPVWNHKTYKNKPVLVKGDGPISVFRRWLKQFYTEANWDEVPEFTPRPQIRSFWLPHDDSSEPADEKPAKPALAAAAH